MYKRILDNATLGKVIMRAPEVDTEPVKIAKAIVAALKEHKTETFMDDNNNPYFVMDVTTLAEKVNVSTVKTGFVLREMGLTKKHFRDGARVFWTEEQILVLEDYFGK